MSIPVDQIRAALLGLLGVQPVVLPNVEQPQVGVPENGKINLTTIDERLLGAPRDTRGVSSFRQYSAFVDYVKQYAGDNVPIIPDVRTPPGEIVAPRIFVVPEISFAKASPLATAYLDYPARGYPRWSTHCATLVVAPSMEYELLLALDGKLFPQDEFARKIRDVSRFCTSLTGADLLELVQTLTLASKGDFKSLNNDLSGAVTLLYDVQVAASAGTATKKINVPEVVTFNLPLLLDGEKVEMTAELLYRVPEQAGGKIHLGLRLPERKFVERDVLLNVVAAMNKDTGLPVAIGETTVPQRYDH
jgi:hypothetical protein